MHDGADALFCVLHDDAGVLKETVVWAPEIVSVVAYGDDPVRSQGTLRSSCRKTDG